MRALPIICVLKNSEEPEEIAKVVTFDQVFFFLRRVQCLKRLFCYKKPTDAI